MKRSIVVAIDGPAGAGKSTIARRIAAKLGFLYVDSGAMYRAVALMALRKGVDLTDPERLAHLANLTDIGLTAGGSHVVVDGEDVTEAIRTPEVAVAASKVSAVPAVRRALVEQQRRMAGRGSVVMEGRDIGSVVLPQADVKVFLDADADARARRRLQELEQQGKTPPPQQLARELAERDHRDRSRAESPLVAAADAVHVDSTHLSIDEVEQIILKLIDDRASTGKDMPR